MKIKYTPYILLVLISICIYSCKHEEEVSRWDADILAPLLHSSLGINDLVVDSLITKNADNSLSIVYKNSLYKASIDTLFAIPDTFAESQAKLQSLVLTDQSVTQSLSLGRIFTESGHPEYNNLNGGTWPIPAISGIKAGPIPIDAGAFFETITLKAGFMDIKINNQLPVDITNVKFQISNQSDGSVIAAGTFPNIPAGKKDSMSLPLAGKTVNRNLFVDLLNLDSPGSKGQWIKIDTSKAIKMTLVVRDLKPSSATAIFPAQNIIDTTKVILLGIKNVELAKVNLRHGDVVMTAYSTLKDSMYLTYGIPSATKNGVPFKESFILPPAPVGGPSQLNIHFDFTGYDLDLRGKSLTAVNTIVSTIVARIEYTGKIKTLSLSDSVYFHVGFENLLPDYATGYLGQQTNSVSNNVPIELFSKISGGTLSLDKVNFSLTIENGIGVEASLLVNSITAFNSRTNVSTALTASTLIKTPINIKGATDNPYLAAPAKTISLDNTNSNINKIIEAMPDRLNYSLETSINPNKNASGSKDFVYYGTGIEASLNMEIPLNLVANKLALTDTVDFEFGKVGSYDKITGGQLTLLSDNGFPFEASVQIYLLDASFNKTDSLISFGKINAADLKLNKVEVKKRSKLNIPIGADKIEKLKQAKKILITANFSSIPVSTPVKIYSDYSIDFKLVGDFKYGIK